MRVAPGQAFNNGEYRGGISYSLLSCSAKSKDWILALHGSIVILLTIQYVHASEIKDNISKDNGLLVSCSSSAR